MGFLNKFTEKSKFDKKNQVVYSIMENLNNILNTKKGYGSFLHDFGIRDMNQYSSREHLASAIMDEVKFGIEKYEPRLQFISISLKDSNDIFSLSFEIECRVKDAAQNLLMEFDSVFNSFKVNKS